MDSSLLHEVVRSALRAGADAAEAVGAERSALSVSVRLGELEEVEREEGGDLGLRVFIGSRAAVVAGSDLSPSARARLVERAVAMARLAPEDPYVGFAPDERLARGPLPDLDLFDPTEPTAEALEAQAAATVSKTVYTILTMNTELEKRNPPAWAALPTQVALNPHPRPNPYNPVRKDVVAFWVTPYSNDQYEVRMTYSDGSMATYLVRGQFFIKGQAFDTNSPDLISASTFKENGKLYVTYLYRNGKQQTVEIPAAA